MSSFEERIKAKLGSNTTIDWSAQPQQEQKFAGLGDGRQAPNSRAPDKTNVLDLALPTINGVVLDVHNGKIVGRLDVIIAVTKVTMSASACHVLRLPSGAYVQIGVSKWENPVLEMIASPRLFAEQCFAIELDGILCISVPTKNATLGSRQLDTPLEVHHLQVGSKIEIPKVSFDYRISKKTGMPYVLGSGAPPTVEQADMQPFVTDRINTMFNILGSECVGFQRQLCRNLARLTNCPHSELVSSAKDDAIALAEHIQNMVNLYNDHLAVIDENRSVTLMSEAAKQSMEDAIRALQTFGASGTEVDFHHVFPFDGRKKHIVPLVQYSMSPSFNTESLNREANGIGINACKLTMLGDDVASDKLSFSAETLLCTSVNNSTRSESDKRTKSIGAICVDAQAINLCIRGKEGWSCHIPVLGNGVAICAKQLLYSANKGHQCDIKNLIGFYDFYKLPMVVESIIKYANVLFFTTEYDQVATSAGFGNIPSSMQPALPSDFGGYGFGDETCKNIIDVATALKTVGILLSKKFVTDNVLFEDGITVVTQEPYQQYGESKDSKGFAPPAPPKLETDGYCPINSIAETNFFSKVRKTPEGCGVVEYYAIFDGCGELKDHNGANKNEEYGETALCNFLKKKHEGLELKEAIKESVAIFAVAIKKAKRNSCPPPIQSNTSGSED